MSPSPASWVKNTLNGWKTPSSVPTDTQRADQRKKIHFMTVKSLFNHGLISHYITCIMTIKDIPVSRSTRFSLVLSKSTLLLVSLWGFFTRMHIMFHWGAVQWSAKPKGRLENPHKSTFTRLPQQSIFKILNSTTIR